MLGGVQSKISQYKRQENVNLETLFCYSSDSEQLLTNPALSSYKPPIQ